MGEVQCPSSRLSGVRCSLPAGHEGPHIQIGLNGVTGWENIEEIVARPSTLNPEQPGDDRG